MKKLLRVVTSALLALLLVANLGLAVFAEDGDTVESTQPTLSITKELQLPAGVTTPDVCFKFDVVQNLGSEAEYGPYIEMLEISYTSADVDVNGDGSIVKSTPDILGQEGIKFSRAGVYSFIVTENATLASGELVEGVEEIIFSEAQYEVYIYVKNSSEDLDGDGKLDDVVIDNVVVEKQVGDDGEPVEGEEGTVKVESSVPGTITSGNTGEDGEGNEGDDSSSDNSATESAGNDFRFINVYNKKMVNPDDPTQPLKSLEISKTVTGEYGDRTNEFAFKLTLTKASTLTDEATYSYQIVEENSLEESGERVVRTDNIVTGTEESFTLKHGQKLVLLGANIGTTYDLTETGVAEYTASAIVVENGVSSTEEGTEGADFTLNDKLVGENANSVAITNAHDTTSIIETGITIDNLPFVILVLVAVLGIAMVVVSRKRREE